MFFSRRHDNIKAEKVAYNDNRQTKEMQLPAKHGGKNGKTLLQKNFWKIIYNSFKEKCMTTT